VNDYGQLFRSLPNVEGLSFRHHSGNAKLVAPPDGKTVVFFLIGQLRVGRLLSQRRMRDVETIISKFPKSGHVRVSVRCLCRSWNRA